MVHYIENFLQLIDDIADGADLAVNYSYLRGELAAFYLMKCITSGEYAYYNGVLLEKECERVIVE
jgi:hypothetical protein